MKTDWKTPAVIVAVALAMWFMGYRQGKRDGSPDFSDYKFTVPVFCPCAVRDNPGQHPPLPTIEKVR